MKAGRKIWELLAELIDPLPLAPPQPRLDDRFPARVPFEVAFQRAWNKVGDAMNQALAQVEREHPELVRGRKGK